MQLIAYPFDHPTALHDEQLELAVEVIEFRVRW
jgi:hypothetical protein